MGSSALFVVSGVAYSLLFGAFCSLLLIDWWRALM